MKHTFTILWLTIILSTISFSSYAQYGLDDFRNIGLNISQPRFKNDFKADGNWYGGRVQASYLYFEYNFGKLYKDGFRETQEISNGFMWSLGASYPLLKIMKSHQMSMTTLRFIPILEGGLTYSRIGIRGEDNIPSAAGLKVSPGLMVKMPFVNISFKADSYVMGSMIWKNDADHAFTGFRFMPTVSIGIDGLADIFTPRSYQNSIDYQKQITRERKVGTYYDWGDHDGDGNLSEKVDVYSSTTTTVNRTEEVSFDIIKNYWHTGARLTAYPQRKSQGQTLLYGPMTGFRFGMFALDAFYQKGDMGVRSIARFENYINASNQNPNFNFSGSFPATVSGGSFSMDMKKMSIRNTSRVADVFWKETTFTRFLMKYNLQYIQKDGDLNYTFEGAEELAQNENTLLRVENNPEFLKDNYLVHGMGLAVELGAASFNYDFIFSKKKAPLLNQHSFTFSIGVPLVRLMKATGNHLKARKQVRKAKRRAKDKKKN
ncbi:MAG: hypothetical protein AB8F94_12215 [Saprospiraceae bacterium]